MPTLVRSYEASTLLALGARGTLDEKPFTLRGRTCVRGLRGSIWNEWTVRTGDGQTVFLAESGGSITLYDEGVLLPRWDDLAPGRPLDVGYVVVERGLATRVAHWGEVADAPRTYRYADLSSRDGATATIDFGGAAPRLFVGRRCTFDELGLTPASAHPTFLPTPDVSRPKGVEPWLAVGDEGSLEGSRFCVLGMVSRSATTADGELAVWDEYLLHDTRAGLAWLVLAGGQWSLVETIEAGLVLESDDGATFAGVRYRALPESTARVDWATGSLPWEVSIGDASRVRDFVDGSGQLSKESTEDEVTWSRGRPLTTDVIAKAFGKRQLPKPR